jgi:DNA-binding MurR/RpiR family transcriptional regulator
MSRSNSSLIRKPLIRRIRECYQDLPDSELAVADLLLEYPGDILLYSATALSERSGVSKAAVTRLVKRLGYHHYREIQDEVRSAQKAGEPIYLNTPPAALAYEDEDFHIHLERDIMNLRHTFDAIDSKDLDELIRTIITARRVWIIGFRNSFFFASYIRRQIIQVRPEVTVLPQPGQVLMEDLSIAGPGDLVIAVGLRRRPPQLRKAMEVLHGMKVPIAYISDRVAVATAHFATWHFPCQVRGVSLFDSYVGVVSLLNYICTKVVEQKGEDGRSRLHQIEDLMELVHEIDTKN